MPASNDAVERNLLRKSLLQVGSLLLLTLLSVTLLALFSVWSLQRAHQRNDQTVTQIVAALDASRQAQVQFKRQVQEWKNILLRGADPVARVRFFNAFADAEAGVSGALAAVASELPAADQTRYRERLQELQQQHVTLGEQYRAALTNASGGHWAPFESDRAVRGIDRPLDRGIDQLAATLLTESRERSLVLDREVQRRYQALQSALWVAMVASLLLVGILLWRVLAVRAATA
jgi:methyl-accepting chemotaxis protein